MLRALIFTVLVTAISLSAGSALERMSPYVVSQQIIAKPEPLKELTLKLKADGATPQLLHVRYSGDEKPEPGEKLLFRIFVDGKELAVQGINRNFPNSMLDEFYPLVTDKNEITVQFKPYDNKSSVASIYAVSVIRQKTEFGRFDKFNGNTISIPGRISYTEPDGPQGWRLHGWMAESDGVFRMADYWGLEFEADLRNTDRAALQFIARLDVLPNEDRDTGPESREVKMTLSKSGKQTFYLKFADFANPNADLANIMYKLKTLELKVDGSGGELFIGNVRLLKGYKFAADTEHWSKPAFPGETAVYDLEITNTSKNRESYNLSSIRRNWEAMTATVEPAALDLNPGESAKVKVAVTVPARIPPGGHEKQFIRINVDGDPGAARTLEFITFAKLSSPFIIHDTKGWAEVREKAAKYDWAKKALNKYLKSADNWQVPELEVYSISPDTKRPYLVDARQEQRLMDAAYAYILTGEKKYAEKAALFLRRISDPEKGFPKTHQLGHQSAVQEGHIFQHVAQAYDLIYNSGALSVEDKANINNTLKIYCDMIRVNNCHPAGANWAVSMQLGALFSAMMLDDLALSEHFVFGPGMLSDKISSYTMPDGWWYECSISYNLWCAKEFTQMSLAMERFGYSLLNRKYPVYFASAPDYQLDDKTELDQRRNVHYGHSFRIFGNIENQTVTIKKMFDAMIPYIDYRGWIFGINDSYENNVGGGRFELAYYAFRDPRYAAFIKRAPERSDLIYGVPELPAETPEIGRGSAYSDNVGLLMLRSNQQEPRERIQAVLKYGTHGGYHGHYDRTGLLSMMRYGRSFFNPEMIWYSYQPFMYNFYVQSSIAKNMVTVDFKQQEVDGSARTLFYTGDMLQAGCVETTSAWSNPGYGGLRWGHIGFPTFSSKTIAEGRYVPIPSPEPRYGSMSGFTEPVQQRRLMGVTDDYIVLIDYVQGQQKHQYDLLYQVKGLLDITAPEKKFIKHTAQLDADPLKSTQFVTDVNWYEVAGTAKMSFLTVFGPEGDNRGTRMNGEPGKLYIDLHHAWPNTRRTLFTGLTPENHGVNRKLEWSVKGDGKELAAGKFGAWILGDAQVNVELKGVTKLELTTAIESRGKINTLFWADAVLETADGKTIPLTTLTPGKHNVLEHKHGFDKDYAGGKINIAGNDYRTGLPADSAKVGVDQPAVYTFDLTGLNAVRLKTVVGGDYPVGPQAERRITSGVQVHEQETVFISVMEPFEKSGVIDKVTASSADSLEVALKDGRIHKFNISGLKDGKNIQLKMSEYKDGKLTKEETAK